MNCSHFKNWFPLPMRENLWLFSGIVALLLVASAQSIALKATSSLSGRVLDLMGNPVPGLGLTLEPIPLQSVEIVSGREYQYQGDIAGLESRTDKMGRFSIHNIVPLKLRLALVSKSDHDSGTSHDILSMKVGALTVYHHQPSAFGGIVFAIKPDAHIENVEVRVKSRQYIRGRIVFADGTPLSSARIDISERHRSPDGRGSGSSSSSNETDAEGYFVYHLDETAFYTVTVNYQGFTATAEPFLLRKGENKEDLIFTLERRPTLVDVAAGRVEVSAKSSTASLPGDMGAWVVNPANGHAYKRIRCESWDDANTQAVAEDAYLVSITDAAEQEWLLKTLKPQHCWIGLTDYANEGEWVWASGEPVTFTNWAPYEPKDNDWGDEDFVLIEHSGEWSDAGPESIEWRMARMAIIEKDGLTGEPTQKK